MGTVTKNVTPFATQYFEDGVHIASVNSLEPGWQLQTPHRAPLAEARITREQAEQDSEKLFDPSNEVTEEEKAQLPKDAEDQTPPTAPKMGGDRTPDSENPNPEDS